LETIPQARLRTHVAFSEAYGQRGRLQIHAIQSRTSDLERAAAAAFAATIFRSDIGVKGKKTNTAANTSRESSPSARKDQAIGSDSTRFQDGPGLAESTGPAFSVQLGLMIKPNNTTNE
jgi:hypothetical protein